MSILKNNQNEVSKNSYIQLKMAGSKWNTQGIGAKIWLETEDKTIFQEVYTARGYLSSSDPVISIGLGTSTQIKSLKILWPDGKKSMMENIKPNQLINVSYNQANSDVAMDLVKPNQTVLTDVTESTGMNFRHKEND